MADNKNKRVFINTEGKFYKGDKPLDISDMEAMHPTEDMLQVLDTEIGVRREEMLGKIIELGNKRLAAVLAPESNPDPIDA